MRVGVGLPTTTPGADGALLVDWARNAEAGPFSSLGVLDRLVYDSYDPFASLAAAAAVTSEIKLATMIAIGPVRPAAQLLKGAASVQALSHGRLTLGLAIGARADDYEVSGLTTKGRGAKLSDQLAELRDWDVSPVVPATARAQRPAAGVRERGDEGARGVDRPRPTGRAGTVGPGLLRARRRAGGRGIPARLLRVHGAVRRQDRRRQPHLAARHPRLRARVRGGRLRRARAAADRRRPRAARPAGRRPRVRTTVLGAGPAGLYLSILLKRADPRHEVCVVERNPPDATFGFGVVFSEETLGRLRVADEPSFTAITDAWASWTTIDIHFGGELIRSHGHRFSAIRRTKLLGILQRRARELGVELRFETEISDLGELPEADLLVGADGVNSLVRRAREFGPRIEVYPTRFAWFGTDVALDAFTFAFVETEHGVFQAHAYPFDEGTSTFIVETREDTWQRAGLESLSEPDSLAFCERLFAPVLDGHRLLSNRSVWLAFNELRCKDWSAGDTVLLGDAAHTAHFSIGSGTKLALEDAIELAGALGRHEELRPALVEYELERRPIVERFQEAARQSAEYFEEVPRHMGLPPLQFAFNLLTRSGRIGHANLSLRDPRLVRKVDAFVGGSAALAPPPLFAPLALRGLVLRNRAVIRGLDEPVGAGLYLSPMVAVTPEGRITPDDPMDPGAWDLDRIHAAGGAAMLVLNHAGARGACRPRSEGIDLPLRDGGWPLVSATATPHTRRSATPAALDEAGMERIRDAFVEAAKRGAAAGFDAIELNLAEGYLLSSFRDGDFPRSVVEAVRAVFAGPLAVRLGEGDAVPDADLVHVAGGRVKEYRRGHLTGASDRIRSEAHVATMVGGYLDTLDAANTIVGAGRADLCILEPAALT